MNATASDSNSYQPANTNGLDDLFLGTGSDISGPDRASSDSPPTPENWWTLADATAALNINERTLRRWIKQGKIEARKVQGPWGDEWRIKPGPGRSAVDKGTGSDISGPDRASPDSPPTPDHVIEQLVALRTRLEIVEDQNAELKDQLQGATYRNGYLQAQLEGRDQQIKLLTDSQHKQGWWTSFCSWFMGQKG